MDRLVISIVRIFFMSEYNWYSFVLVYFSQTLSQVRIARSNDTQSITIFVLFKEIRRILNCEVAWLGQCFARVKAFQKFGEQK